MSCEALYNAVVSGGSKEGYDLFELAACFLGGFDPEKLRSMLKSNDFALVSDGLFICGEIGPLAANYIAEIRLLSGIDDDEISLRASDLLKLYERSDEGSNGRRAR